MKVHRLVSAAAGAVLGAGIYCRTKKIQKKAAEKGMHVPYGPYEAVLKRPADVVLSVGALVVLSPIMAVTGMLVKYKSGSPVVFSQQRAGCGEHVFQIYKFRTMTDQHDAAGRLLPDEKRLTDFGKRLRETSLDELPELWNILKGDMSIVGPRPLLTEYLPRYNSCQRHRHDVRPGLTGLAQVSGRNAVSWEERFTYDVRYVEKVTFLGDLKILMKTIGVVLGRTGISSPASATMEKFVGNRSNE